MRGEVRAVRREGSIAGHGKERTLNMACMFVTLDVSKLSGWLNAFASCREGIRCWACGPGGGRRRATAAVHTACRGGLDCRSGEERTPNIQNMSVTLEVSKFTGWLNAVAPCRESQGGPGVDLAWGGAGASGVRLKCHGRSAPGTCCAWL